MDSTTDGSINFGKNYAVLNLDWITVLIDAVKDTPEGQALIENLAKWNDAVHARASRPITIFSTLSFYPGQPEVQAGTPFANLIAPFGEFRHGSPETQIHKAFNVDSKDIVLAKTRWSATTGSVLEQILQAHGVKTVIISGLTLSGVVMATIYRLFDLDYSIYVIRENVLELPVEQHSAFANVMLDKLLPKMGIKIISVDEAINALS
ncbi:cysteine hydrolase family protein [Aspergillus eucalypticola CBS 122712]|uniref:Cysteine hydrolase family protein n=1 Tax=Aspergillus eucalypticola (strain CBS 122712 / IBT 29274) TaxID=1448314 RepID=A0A317VAC5_ASPEC|nr:cysteine hydrolase family protein [Aspergillus eucalypticola CBS 122712]PWY71303.1 cysteine hydrolase family protein [Aspergillus eucalypticola CBS 122712]